MGPEPVAAPGARRIGGAVAEVLILYFGLPIGLLASTIYWMMRSHGGSHGGMWLLGLAGAAGIGVLQLAILRQWILPPRAPFYDDIPQDYARFGIMCALVLGLIAIGAVLAWRGHRPLATGLIQGALLVLTAGLLFWAEDFLRGV